MPKHFETEDAKDPPVRAVCDDCGWEGKPSDCETFEDDSNGWEHPSYSVAICPKCEGDGVVFLRQSDIEGMEGE